MEQKWVEKDRVVVFIAASGKKKGVVRGPTNAAHRPCMALQSMHQHARTFRI